MFGEDLGAFTRYSYLDNAAGSASQQIPRHNNMIWLNWWVDKDVVVKVDYQIQDVGRNAMKRY